MKNYINRILIGLAAVALLNACEVEEFEDVAPAELLYVGVQGPTSATNVIEGNTDGNEAVVQLLHNVNGQTVTFTSTGTAQLGTDFMVMGTGVDVSGDNFTVTLSSDTVVTNFSVVTVPNFDTAPENLIIELEVSQTPSGVVTDYPLPGAWTIELLDDDCTFVPANFESAGDVTIVAEENAFGPGETEGGTTVLVNDTGTGIATYEADLQPWTFGLGIRFNFIVDATDPANVQITVPTQTFNAFGESWTIEDIPGGDLLNTCGNEITVNALVYDTGTFGNLPGTDRYVVPMP